MRQIFRIQLKNLELIIPEYLPLSLPACPTRPEQRGKETRQMAIEVEPFCLDLVMGVASSGQAAEPTKCNALFCKVVDVHFPSLIAN